MKRYVPDYEEAFAYREITITDLQALRRAVGKRFGAEMYCAEVKAVEQQAFEQEWGISWEKFCALLEKHRADFRRYSFYFYPGKYDKGAPITRVQFELHVIRRSKFGDRDDAERHVALRGLGCYPQDFEAFVEITVGTLQLQKRPPAGMDSDDVAIEDWRMRAIRNPDLAASVSGALATRRYEEAMQNAVILVESKLRDKCVWAGRNDAKTVTGNDLAVIAYHPDTGCLRPPWPVAANAEQGAMQLFMGFIQYLRNAFGHNAVVMGGDKSSVSELLAFCEFLLRIIEKSTKR